MSGLDEVPGVTINRYCSSSLQTTRMATHAIKAGEGDCFISAGVETVSRYMKGMSDGSPDTTNPIFDEADGPHRRTLQGGATSWEPARRPARHLHRHGPDRRERRLELKGVSRERQDEFAAQSQNRAEAALRAAGSSSGRSPR